MLTLGAQISVAPDREGPAISLQQEMMPSDVYGRPPARTIPSAGSLTAHLKQGVRYDPAGIESAIRPSERLLRDLQADAEGRLRVDRCRRRKIVRGLL